MHEQAFINLQLSEVNNKGQESYTLNSWSFIKVTLNEFEKNTDPLCFSTMRYLSVGFCFLEIWAHNYTSSPY